MYAKLVLSDLGKLMLHHIQAAAKHKNVFHGVAATPRASKPIYRGMDSRTFLKYT